MQYAPLMSSNQQVGQAYLYRGDQPWIYLSLAAPNFAPDAGAVDCEVVHDDGTITRVGSVSLDHGQAAWGGPAPAPPDRLVGARVVHHTGHTLAVARFRPRTPKESLTTTTTTTTTNPATGMRRPAESSNHDGRQDN